MGVRGRTSVPLETFFLFSDLGANPKSKLHGAGFRLRKVTGSAGHSSWYWNRSAEDLDAYTARQEDPSRAEWGGSTRGQDQPTWAPPAPCAPGLCAGRPHAASPCAQQRDKAACPPTPTPSPGPGPGPSDFLGIAATLGTGGVRR